MGNTSSNPPSKKSEEATKKRVVVLGAGAGGLCMARIADAAGFQTTVVERRPGSVWKPGGPKAIIDPEWAMGKGLVPLRNVLEGASSTRIQDEAVRLDAAGKKVELASGKVLEYDYCVLAVGAQNASPCDPPPECTTVAAMKAHYRAVDAAIRRASRIVVVGGGAVGIEVAGACREAAQPKTSVTVVHSGEKPLDVSLPGANPKQMANFQDRIVKLCADANIQLVLGARCTNLSPDDCPGGFKASATPFGVQLTTGSSLEADLVLWCVGARSNAPHLVAPEALDPRSKLIKVDRSLRVDGMSDVFAIGDCTNLPEPKLSLSAGSGSIKGPGMPSGHADVVLANLLALAAGKQPSSEWPPPKRVNSLIPITKSAGAAALGAPNFLGAMKATKLHYFAPSMWHAARAGKFGVSPVTAADELGRVQTKLSAPSLGAPRLTPAEAAAEQEQREAALREVRDVAPQAEEAEADEAAASELAEAYTKMSEPGDDHADVAALSTPRGDKAKIAIIYYSMYGHVRTMADAVKKGVESSGLASVEIFQLPETLPAEVLAKMGAPPKADHPVATVEMLPDFDGFLFGLPGRYGSYPAQFKAFWDATGGHWAAGKLVGKPVGVFVSTGTQNGGQETIGLTAIPQFAHHGMVFVPLGYQDPRVFSYDEPHGASPYGAGTLAGPDGSRQPSALELGVAETQGTKFAAVAAKAVALPKALASSAEHAAAALSALSVSGARPQLKIAIIYYSMYGHIRTMADAVKTGVEASGLATAEIFQLPETLPAEVLAKMGAPPKADHPVATVEMLPDFDGFLFGLPGRYGSYPAQFKAFWDATGGHWAAGKLVGKPVGVFVSTGTQNGGQETIGLTAIPQFAHHGMVFVPLGYQDPRVFSYDEPHGASPYGAGTLAGPDGSRQPSALELGVAETQGTKFAVTVSKLAA